MIETLKIFIVGKELINKNEIANILCDNDDNLTVARRFTTIEAEVNSNNYYLCPEDVFIGYKNNAFLLVQSSEDNNHKGITMDEFYNSDVVTMTIEEFNEIPNGVLRRNNILVIWLDTKKKNMRILDVELMQTKHFIERLNFVKYMYFLDDESAEVAGVIKEYYQGSPKAQKSLLEEYS